jgi:hypothetical protein
MKLSELHYLQLLEEARVSFLTHSENRIFYLNELKNRLELTVKIP